MIKETKLAVFKKGTQNSPLKIQVKKILAD